MIEALKSDDLVKKVGGRFRLTALLQRRIGELVAGARPLVSTQGRTMVEVAIQELIEDKITIDYDKSDKMALPAKGVDSQAQWTAPE